MTPSLPQPDAPEARAWETCWKCSGSGHGMTMGGDPDGLCWECKGDAVLRARDAKGRFVGNPKEMRR